MSSSTVTGGGSTLRPDRSRVVPGALAIVLFIAAIALALDLGGARALEGTIGPINVTVTPTSNLLDGQEIAIHAAATDGTMSEIAAHICQPGKTIDNNAKWGFQGQFCSNLAPGTGDFTKSVLLANTTSGDLTFKAGTTDADGITWVNEQGFPRDLTCDMTHVCDLVVRIQSSVSPGTYFFTAPLSFADPTTTTQPVTTTTQPVTTTTQAVTTTTQPVTTTTTSAPLPITLSVTQGPPGTAFSLESDTWKPGSEVTVTFNSDPIVLGDLTADADGNVQGTFAVPASVAPGAHTVKLDGTSAEDVAQSLSVPFTVTTANTSGTATGAPVTTSGSGGSSSPLAFTGASTRDLASAGILMLVAGLLAIDFSIRRRAAQG